MIRTPVRSRRVLALPLTLACLAVAHPAVATEYRIQQLGLIDPAHEISPNVYHSSASTVDAAGDIAGLSARASTDTTPPTDAWFYDHVTGQTIQLGTTTGGTAAITAMNATGDTLGSSSGSGWLYDNTAKTTFSISSSSHDVTPKFLNDSGQATGLADTSTAWFFDKQTGTTTKIGLSGQIDITKYADDATPLAMDSLGQVFGQSTDFLYSTHQQTATQSWMFDPLTMQTTQLAIPANETPDGYSPTASYSHGLETNGAIPLINNQGDVAVAIQAADGSASNKSIVMLYNPRTGSLQQAGLVDAAHRDSNGKTSSGASYLNDAGQMAGTSGVYSGTGGFDSWFFEKTTGITVKIGLTSGMYVGADGTPANYVVAMNGSGDVIGKALVGSVQNGESQFCWFYNPQTNQTVPLGFTGPDYTDSAGHRLSLFQNLVASPINARGQVVGTSERFTNGIEVGYDAWFFNPTTNVSTPVGIFDPLHSRAGVPENEPTLFNDNGDVAGYSIRWNASAANGIDTWYFDSNTNTTYPLNFSTRTDGYAYSIPKYLTPDGTILGFYEKFSGSTDLGRFAFSFNPLTGPTDLSLNVSNLSDAGWQQLLTAVTLLDSGKIIGTGRLAADASTSTGTNGTTAYLLTPLAPGDANGDGTVDLNDLNTVLNNLGASTSLWSAGNFDGASTIDLNDLNAVLNHLGTSGPAFSQALATLLPTPTPEPTSLSLLTLAALPLLRRRHRNA